jgi:murein DD-endopeptidase MepM/ murein hydrolase activator NlpD
MKKILLVLILIIVALAIFFLIKNPFVSKTNQPVSLNNQNQALTNQSQAVTNQPLNQNSLNLNTTPSSGFQPPLDRAGERVIKKPFGIYITPATSPIQPENFSGYHTGADFEILSDELNKEVQVKAVCSGNLKLKKYATGYGGVAVQECQLYNEVITVIYGHLKLSSITASVDKNINIGETIGILGADKSTETSGERKHLHLGFHKGTAINILGYVSAQKDLESWIDPCLYVCY